MLTLLLLLILQDASDCIEKLGDTDPEVREKAAEALIRMGTKAVEPLRGAAKSDDPEIAERARKLLEEIDWPEAGKTSNGLAVAIKAKKEYDGEIVIRGRLINRSDKDLVLTGKHVAGEGGNFLLQYGGKELHFCYRPAGPAPEVPEKLTIKRGQHFDFKFSPRAWCAVIKHSRCVAVSVPKGAHRIRLKFVVQKGTWKGEAVSNEAAFEKK